MVSMKKILFIANNLVHSKVMKNDTKEYYNFIHTECKFFESICPSEALDILKNEQINIVFVDIASNKFDGIQLLKDIQELNLSNTHIVGVTTLYDNKYRFEALKLNVYKYIYRPYDNKEISAVLSTLFHDSVDLNNTNDSSTNEEDEFLDFDEEDEFMDFDDEEFMDFDDENEIDHSQELMNIYNDSHKKVTAKEFLLKYQEDGIDEESLEDLEEELDKIVANILFDNNLESELSGIIYMLEKYNRFLYMFSEFEELSKVIYELVQLLKIIDFSVNARIEMISKFIVAIIQDLVEWKEHVFVVEDAVDVFYINASILNSYVQLKDIIKR